MSSTTNPPFKVGDKVICIDAEDKVRIKKGMKYVVRKCYLSDNTWFVAVLDEDEDYMDGYYTYRFRLAKPWNYRG